MKFQLKKIRDCKHALKIEVDEKRIVERYDEVYREFQKKAKLKGFREGKAPLDMVRTTFRVEAEEEVTKSLIGEAYYDALRESKLTPVGSPDIKDLRMEKKLTFTAEFENVPVFNLKNYKGIRLEKPPVAVADDEVQKSLERLRETRAKVEPLAILRPVQEGDVILCDVEIHQNGQYAPGRKDILFGVDRRSQPDLAEQLIGAEAGQSRDITGEPSPEEKEQGIVGRKPLYRIHVKEIRVKNLPEFDDELAKQFGKDTFEDLKRQVAEDLRSYRESEVAERLKEMIYEELLKSHDMELPDALVERQMKRLLEQMDPASGPANGASAPAGEAKLEAAKRDASEKAKKQVKLFFILEKIAASERIEPSAEDIERRVKELAEQTQHTEEEIRRIFEDDIYQNLRQSKTAEYLLANANLKEEKK